MPKQMPISEFKARCIAELKEVHQTGLPIVVTLRGKPIVKVEAIRPVGEPAVRLGRKRGEAIAKRDLVKFEFTEEWEMNR